ncbi:hypothetical protein C7S18_06115 [Ahniella affigens]|uniref:DUF4926 domain-containing protein n=1 Tax=Ahniella affigens TaxID=2021234 RepID=A0A2P1PPM3_9GAMM|nr:hypothetical protein C7S18_06115 [Ahniella affigens]
MKPFDVVRITRLRDDRFALQKPDQLRHPAVGDIGAIVEAYTWPSQAFEVECVDPNSGATVWLEAMYPEELELVQSYS